MVGEIAIVAIVVLVIGIIAGCCILWQNGYRNSQANVTIAVNDKERKGADGDGYLIYAKGETFTIEDSATFGQYYSSDLYGSLERGKKYDCTVAGWRNGRWSTYRNIIKCSPHEEPVAPTTSVPDTKVAQ